MKMQTKMIVKKQAKKVNNNMIVVKLNYKKENVKMMKLKNKKKKSVYEAVLNLMRGMIMNSESLNTKQKLDFRIGQ
jgi:hypothetical protein